MNGRLRDLITLLKCICLMVEINKTGVYQSIGLNVSRESSNELAHSKNAVRAYEHNHPVDKARTMENVMSDCPVSNNINLLLLAAASVTITAPTSSVVDWAIGVLDGGGRQGAVDTQKFWQSRHLFGQKTTHLFD